MTRKSRLTGVSELIAEDLSVRRNDLAGVVLVSQGQLDDFRNKLIPAHPLACKADDRLAARRDVCNA